MKQPLDLNLIRILCAVVEVGTVTQAALRLDMGISAVSYGLGKLRQHYLDPIVIRTGNGMEPTVTALSLYKSFKPALELLANAENAHDNQALNLRKNISIRCNSMFEWRLTHELLTGNTAAIPSLDFLYYAVNIKSRLELLRKRQTDIDIGFALEDDSSIIKYPLHMEGTVLLCRQDHPRLQKTVNLEQLKEENLLTWAPPHESIEREMYYITFDGYRAMNRPYRSSSMINLLLNVQFSDSVIFAPSAFGEFCCNMLSLRVVECPFLPEQFYNTYLHIHKSQKDDPEIQHIVRQITGWSNG